jgi:uncharacterized membrane protein YjjB (DUF3815 family)
MPPFQESHSEAPNRRPRWVAPVLRFLGGVIGVAVFALVLMADAPERAIWPRWAMVAGLLGTGVYFFYFALTGRSNPISALLRRLR